MTHSLNTSQVDNALVANPSTLTYTCGAGTTLLVLGITLSDANARSGGAPTYNGVALTQAATTQQSAGFETVTEMWYMLGPPTGAALTISIPNTVGPRTINAVTSSWISATGASALDVAAGNLASSGTPSTNITPLNGSLVIDRVGDGVASLASLTETLTLLASTDHGAHVSGAQYTLSALSITSVTWTSTTEDWTHVVAAFKEVVMSISASETVTLSETVTVVVSAPQVIAGETVTLSETVTVATVLQVSTSETITLTEQATAFVTISLNVSETITLTETVTVAPLLLGGVSVGETVTLTEGVTVAPLSLAGVSVSETITLSETATVAPLLLAGVSVEETITLTELAALTVITLAAILPNNAAYVRWQDNRAIVKGGS